MAPVFSVIGGGVPAIALTRATFAIIPARRAPRPLPEIVLGALFPVRHRGSASGGDHALRIRCICDCDFCWLLLMAPSHAGASATADTNSCLARVGDGVDRQLPQQAGAVAHARRRCKALSESGALREPETAGFYVGFVAGVLGANPKDAERLVGKMLPLPPADQWLVVRAIAYSGLPAWKSLLARTAAKVPARRGMVDAYLTGALPTLDAIELDKSPTFLEKSASSFGVKPKAAGGVLRPQSRNCSTRCGASISPPASTGRSGASSRCCRGRRSATAPSG